MEDIGIRILSRINILSVEHSKNHPILCYRASTQYAVELLLSQCLSFTLLLPIGRSTTNPWALLDVGIKQDRHAIIALFDIVEEPKFLVCAVPCTNQSV